MDSGTLNTFTSYEMPSNVSWQDTVFNFTEIEHCSLNSEIS